LYSNSNFYATLQVSWAIVNLQGKNIAEMNSEFFANVAEIAALSIMPLKAGLKLKRLQKRT
jgi:hypothetical protein